MIGAAPTLTRAARLQLTARLEFARHAVGLLHSKEEALARERVRLAGHADRSRDEWHRRIHEAASWLVRARTLGATDELTALIARRPTSAAMTAHWQTSMGTAYPGSVECTPGGRPTLTSTAALASTTDHYRLALQAAATHAGATAAIRRLDAELGNTRRRRRAIEERLEPRLETELVALDLHLDELDREEALRVRIAKEQMETEKR